MLPAPHFRKVFYIAPVVAIDGQRVSYIMKNKEYVPVWYERYFEHDEYGCTELHRFKKILLTHGYEEIKGRDDA